MNTRREFLALMKGFGIGAAAGLVGIRVVPPAYDPIHVPNDRLPMVSWTASPASTTTFTVHDDVVWYDAHGTAAS